MTDKETSALLDESDSLPVKVSAADKKSAKESYLPVVAEAWRAEKMPSKVIEYMTEGHVVPVSDPPPAVLDIPLYPEKVKGDNQDAADEAERAIKRGALRYAEPHEVHMVHPWVMVRKTDVDGTEKLRACHDYSRGINQHVPQWPFSLPRVWDVRKYIGRGSYFAKYDISDGFWLVPIAERSQKYLGLRHPLSGRLMVSTRLPFGYALSPAIFCEITEAIAQRLRTLGVQVIVYCDDFLIVGRDRADTQRGMRIFEDLLARLHIQLAPHKKEGPTRSLDFLGLRLCNLPGFRYIGLPPDKAESTMAALEDLLAAHPQGSRISPRALARVLGKLNFASMVVEAGEVFLSRLYDMFRGVVVDWKRGLVRFEGDPRELRMTEEARNDLLWWQENLQARHSVSILPRHLRSERRADATISGTDASDLGRGALVWLSGAREEVTHN